MSDFPMVQYFMVLKMKSINKTIRPPIHKPPNYSMFSSDKVIIGP